MQTMISRTFRGCLWAALVTGWWQGGALWAQTYVFTNTASVVIPLSDQGDGVADPYPSAILVSNLPGTVASVTLTLYGLSHESPDDMDMLLVSPDAATVVFCSGMGEAFTGITNVTLTVDDAALLPLPDISSEVVSGTYRPTQYYFQEDYSFNEEGSYTNVPDGPYGTNLLAVAGGNPNGAWLLFIDDNGPGFSGVLSNGWSLAITLADSNQPPVLVGPGEQSVIVGSNLVVEISADDSADNDFITLTASNLPAGAVFNPTNGNGTAAGTLVWENAGPVGVYTSLFFAADDDGVATQEMVITVSPAPAPTLDVLALDVSGSQLVLRWESEVSYTYRVLISTNLLDPDGGFSEIATDVQGKFPETAITTTPAGVSAVYRVIGDEFFMPPPP